MIGRMLLALLLVPSAQDTSPEPPSLARFPDWAERDAEGRWALFARDLALDDDAPNAWQPFLTETRDFSLLEWIVLTQPKSWSGSRSALAAADAPQWIRASVFRLTSSDSHAAQNARTNLTQHAAAFLGWLELHPEARRGATGTFADGLEAPPNRAAAASYDPPLTETELFGALYAENPIELGDAKTAAAGVVYVQAVERAIMTAVTTTERSPELLERLLAIARGTNLRLARAACLAFTQLSAPDIPDAQLAKLAADAKADPTLRELAFLAASYGVHPRAWVRLHLPALDPTDPHWRAAVSRLGEVGDDFTLVYLTALAPDTLAPADRELFNSAGEQIGARLAADSTPFATRVQPLLERAAWGDLACAPLERTIVHWTLERIRSELADPDVHRTLRELASGYDPAESVASSVTIGGVGEMGPRVRKYAKDLLAE